MNRPLPTLFALTLVLALSACGWHLRGIKPLPDYLKRLHIISKAPETFNQRLKRSLELNGATIFDKFDETLAVLEIKQFTITRRERTISASGQIAEYQLDAYLLAEIIDQSENRSREISINEGRFFSNDLSNQVGTAANEALQRENIQQQLIDKLILQLESVSLKNKSNDKTKP